MKTREDHSRLSGGEPYFSGENLGLEKAVGGVGLSSRNEEAQCP